ncbi:hypothetical protein EVAR_6123_1 [Eumeta japonica]|uniref:Uncharacterized protein n=1 Tax=Eumeta variegata TaxID=151549 RepID=A0A4C1TE72_EUMVA|nr:hypothetical protein EVAR_6123_1 [Eumeta japonica]
MSSLPCRTPGFYSYLLRRPSARCYGHISRGSAGNSLSATVDKKGGPNSGVGNAFAIAQRKEWLARAEAELARASLKRMEAESALLENETASQIDKTAMVKEWAESQHLEEYEVPPPVTAPPALAVQTQNNSVDVTALAAAIVHQHHLNMGKNYHCSTERAANG